MIAHLNQIPSEAKIKKELRRILYGKNLHCPWCRGRQVIASDRRYWCKHCRRHFGLFSGTWLSGMKLSLRTWYALLWCWTQGVPVKQTPALCHISEEGVRRWFRRFRVHLPAFEPVLEHTVQMDEAYFRNISLLLAKQTGSCKLARQIIPASSVNRQDAAHFLFQHVKPRSQLQTDGASIYQGIEKWWQVKHKRDIHSQWEFSLTSEIEGMFGNLRTFIRRMYHHATPEYLPEYVSEFCVRFSSPEIFTSPFHYVAKTLKPVPFD